MASNHKALASSNKSKPPAAATISGLASVVRLYTGLGKPARFRSNLPRAGPGGRVFGRHGLLSRPSFGARCQLGQPVQQHREPFPQQHYGKFC